MTINHHKGGARWDRPGPLPKAIQARIHELAKRESHERFLGRMGADESGFINSRPGPIQDEVELDDDDAAGLAGQE